MNQKITKVWICLIGMLLCLEITGNQWVLAATPSYHAYSGGVTRGTIRYVSQSTSTASVNGWGSYASKANGECGYASQSMALSYVGKDIPPEYLCYGEYAKGKWHTGYGNNISGTYEIAGINVVSGSGKPSGGTAVNTINSMLTNFINDNGRGQYSPVVIHYASSSVEHAIIVIGKDANGNYLTLDPARGMNIVSMTLSASGAVGGNVTYAANGCKINGVQQYYNSTNPEPQPTEKPTNVVIALEKATFFTDEHITFYCTGLYADYYVISIYNAQGNIVETVKVNPGEYCTRYYDPGDYMVYCEAYNSLGNTFSNTIKFTVKSLEKPANIKIALEKNNFLTTDYVTYYCTGDNVSYFIITIYDNKGNVIETVKINPGEYCTRYYDIGEYTAYCEGYNSCGNAFSNTISFKVKSATEITELHKHNYSFSIKKPATCTESGIMFYTCKNNDDSYEETIPATGHQHTELRNVKSATCKSEGYTGDSYCTVCNQKISTGKKIAKTAHSWDKGKITKQPTTLKTGIKTYTCTKCKTTRTETIAKLKQKTLAVGKIIKDKATNGVYKVLKGGLSVEFTKPITKKASVKIPDTIKVSGVTCKVTGISANAFKNNSSLKTISIGKNVTTIGNSAFYGCKKLNKITGGNSIAKIGDKAFANCGSLSSVTIAGSVRSIGKQAFYNCKKLKSIVVNTVALTDKNIGAKAFTGTYVKPTVKVPAKQLKAYQKLLRSKGMSSKAKYVRFQISVFYKASGNYF